MSIINNVIAFISALMHTHDEERGASAVEYALLVTGIAIVLLVGVQAFGTDLSTFFTDLGDTVGLNGSD